MINSIKILAILSISSTLMYFRCNNDNEKNNKQLNAEFVSGVWENFANENFGFTLYLFSIKNSDSLSLNYVYDLSDSLHPFAAGDHDSCISLGVFNLNQLKGNNLSLKIKNAELHERIQNIILKFSKQDTTLQWIVNEAKNNIWYAPDSVRLKKTKGKITTNFKCFYDY